MRDCNNCIYHIHEFDFPWLITEKTSCSRGENPENCIYWNGDDANDYDIDYSD